MTAPSLPAGRGAFIVLEGLDRSGKSTQVSRLAEEVAKVGKAVLVQKFPDRGTAIGKMINNYLQSESELDDRAIHLLFSANRWECASLIEHHLAQGTNVIADRYAFSGIAFSAAKGLPFDYCLNPDAGLPLPDLTIYLTVPPDVASSRSAYGSERYETVDIQTRVREQFELVAQHLAAKHDAKLWHSIVATGSIEEVKDEIWGLVEPLLHRELPVSGRLWL